YTRDNRIMRYAEALAERGDSVEIISLRSHPKLAAEETINGVRVHRIQDRLEKNEKSRAAFLWRLLRFICASSVYLNRLHRAEPFDLIHVHNVPDFLVACAWLPKLQRTKVILDIHDIMPELYCSKFRKSADGLVVRALRISENLSARMADHVILANHLWLE